jgi:hypothetical protein
VVVPAELPTQINAFKRQQFRWAKGSIQTTRKLIVDVWRSSNPMIKKIEGTIHLTHYAIHPLMLFNLLMSFPLISIKSPVLWILPFYIFAALGPLLMYWVAMGEEGQSIFQRITNLIMLLVLGMGLSLNNSLAVIEAVLGKTSAFLRTPKLNIRGKNVPKMANEYVLPRDPNAWVEIILALYTIGLLVYGMSQGVWGLVIWLLLYAGGYTYIASLNFKQGFVRRG